MSIKKSSKGFPFQHFVLSITFIFTTFFLTLGLLKINPTEKDDSDWIIFFLFAGITLLLGGFALLIYPTTYQIELNNDKISISSKRKYQEIALTKIKNIEPLMNFSNSTFTVHEIYLIEFTETTKFGKKVYFKTLEESMFMSRQNFGEKLKAEWIRDMHAKKHNPVNR